MWTDGYKYTGGWENGIKSGYGEYFYNNGDVYRGMVRSCRYTLSFIQSWALAIFFQICYSLNHWFISMDHYCLNATFSNFQVG